MKTSFVETMRGSLTTQDGLKHPLDFEIKAEAPSLLRFLRDGTLQLSGVLHASPWASEVPAAGTMEIALAHGRIGYRLRFGTFRLEGDKRVRPAALLPSMTTLPVTLSDSAGTQLATGEVRFDLRDLPGFLRSFLPFRRLAQQRLDEKRRNVEQRPAA